MAFYKNIWYYKTSTMVLETKEGGHMRKFFAWIKNTNKDFYECRNSAFAVKKRDRDLFFITTVALVYAIIAILSGFIYFGRFDRGVFEEYISFAAINLVTLLVLLLIYRLVPRYKNKENLKLNARFLQHLTWFYVLATYTWSAHAMMISGTRSNTVNYVLWIVTMISVGTVFTLNPYEILVSNIYSLTLLLLKLDANDVANAGVTIIYSVIVFVVIDTFLMVNKYFTYISDYKKGEAVAEMQEERERFMVSFTHEMRTPLNAVLGKNRMILNDTQEVSTRQLASEINSSGKILLSLINDLLDLSKMQAGKMNIVPNAYSASTISYELADIMRSEAKAKDLGFKLEIGNNMPAGLYGDDVRIRQVIMNLLSNAIKYTKEGSVSLRMDFKFSDDEKKSGYLSVGVIDTGIGIKKEDIPKLAKVFSRVDEDKNRNIKGTGLGLAIVSSLLKLMGSKLEVESTYGLGSMFSFTIWQSVTDPTPLKEKVLEAETNKEKFIATSANVLVVDDNKVNFSVCKGLMKYYGFTPDFAQGGRECLEMILKKDYDIIFLDHQMPEMNGIETLEKIRETYPNIYKKTPIVALTANESAHSKSEYLGYGFRDYLSKPIDADKLHNILGTYLPKDKVAILNR